MAKKKEKKTNPLSTKLVYLDLSVVLANYRNPEFWGKQWIIYKSGNIEIYWMMTNINVCNQTIQSEVHARSFWFKSGKYSRYWHDSSYFGSCEPCRSIPINNPDYKQETFEANILGSVLLLIKDIETDFIHGYAEYRSAQDLEEEQEDALREIAEKVAKEHIVKEDEYSETIRDAVIDKYLDDHRIDLRSRVLANYDHKVIGSLYLMVCSWFGNEKLFEEHKDKMGDNGKKHIWLDMFLKAKELQTDEWRNAMAKELEDQLDIK